MKTWTKILTALVAIQTLLFGIYWCSDLKFDANSPSVLISALSALITFVVAWQIWQTMASREEIKEARDVSKKFKALEKKVNDIVPMTDAHLQSSIAAAMQMKGLDIHDVQPKNMDDETKRQLSHKALFTWMTLNNYLSVLKMYFDIELNAKENIERCLWYIQNTAMRLFGHYNLLTKELVKSLISDVNSVLTHSGKVLTQQQISVLENLKNELERNLSNAIDADAALKGRQQQRDAKHGNQSDITDKPS